ncbi:unnamed protein product [Cuscuta campestris]|uniref:Uncharacterized protein n=1 Tax=Cuscuta campestris TaxID=132261 RepID=A0A484K5P1_9ASTE|nr:unnamed protein product [Cuscuta campestris]
MSPSAQDYSFSTNRATEHWHRGRSDLADHWTEFELVQLDLFRLTQHKEISWVEAARPATPHQQVEGTKAAME